VASGPTRLLRSLRERTCLAAGDRTGRGGIAEPAASASYIACRAPLSRAAPCREDDGPMHTPQPDYPTPVEPMPPEPLPNDPKPYPQPMQ
jgi:hypothetical protein